MELFGLEANKGGTPKPDKNPICRSCKRSIPTKGGNTSNLMAHLKEHHADLYVEALSAQKSKDRRKNVVDSDSASTSGTGKHSVSTPTSNIKEVLLASRKYTANSPQALELNKAVTYFIAKDAQPFSVVEKPRYHENTLWSMKFHSYTARLRKIQWFPNCQRRNILLLLLISEPVLHMFHL